MRTTWSAFGESSTTPRSASSSSSTGRSPTTTGPTLPSRTSPSSGSSSKRTSSTATRYGGRHLLYVANYVEPGDPLLSAGHEELLDVYEPGLRRINPDFSRRWIRHHLVFREPSAQPVVTVGYGDRIPAVQTGVDGLLLANTTQIYPEDRGTNYSVELGEQAADAILSSMAVTA